MGQRDLESIAVDDYPGHYIRRLQQIAVALFMEETESLGVTPVQFASLLTAYKQPGTDQKTLASMIGFDKSTIGSVIDRLEARGFVQRRTSKSDRRLRLINVTSAGKKLLEDIVPPMLEAQRRILEPLDPDQREQFMSMLKVIVNASNELSRAPQEGHAGEEMAKP